MFLKSILGATAAVALTAGFFSPSSVSAAPISFLGGNDGSANGISLSCNAFGIFNDSCNVTLNAAGLGVNGEPDTAPDQIDGNPIGSSERLTISFGKNVKWNSITFGMWDSDDDATLFADGGATLAYDGNGNVVDLEGYVSSQLTIRAYGNIVNDVDGVNWFPFYLKGDDAFTVEAIDVSAVPLPASSLMLLAGVGGLAAMRRRQKKNKS